MQELSVILRLQGVRPIIRDFGPQLRVLGKSENELFELLVAHYIRDEITHNLDLFSVMTLHEAETLEEEMAILTLFECYESVYETLKFKNNKTMNRILSLSSDIIIEKIMGDALYLRCTRYGVLLS